MKWDYELSLLHSTDKRSSPPPLYGDMKWPEYPIYLDIMIGTDAQMIRGSIKVLRRADVDVESE